MEQVETGRKLVDEAGEAMEDIVTSVQLVADIMIGAAVANQQQSAGIGQVNQAITPMDEITQQNAALVEQAAAAFESMQAQAMKLALLVDTFKLSESGRTAGPARTIARKKAAGAFRAGLGAEEACRLGWARR